MLAQVLPEVTMTLEQCQRKKRLLHRWRERRQPGRATAPSVRMKIEAGLEPVALCSLAHIFDGALRPPAFVFLVGWHVLLHTLCHSVLLFWVWCSVPIRAIVSGTGPSTGTGRSLRLVRYRYRCKSTEPCESGRGSKVSASPLWL